MATFGVVKDRSEIFPHAGKVTAHRDMSWIADYQGAIKDVQDEGAGAGGYIQLDDMSDETFNTERKRIKLAARKMGLVLNVRRVRNGEFRGHLGFIIEPDKAPAMTSYEKLKAEADALGMTVLQLKEQKKAESAASGEDKPKRGRRPKNAEAPAGELVSV